MPYTSKRGDIKKAIDEKLRSIKTAQSYQTNVVKVYSDESEDDKIPMGLDFDEAELPAILSLAGDDTFGRDEPGKGLTHGCVFGNFELELQLWHNEVLDTEMHAFVRDVFKCLYVGTATGSNKSNAFKALHPCLYDLKPLKVEHDLNMIDGNRCYTVMLIAQYTTKLWDL